MVSLFLRFYFVILCTSNCSAAEGKTYIMRTTYFIIICITHVCKNTNWTAVSRYAKVAIIDSSSHPADGREHVGFRISTLNKHTKPESRQNSIPLNLSAYFADREAARRPPTQSQGQARVHTLDCREQTGRRGDLYFTEPGPGTQGLAKVNNSTSRPVIDGNVPFYTVNRCQTVVELSGQITKDLQHPRITQECLSLILHHLAFDSM